MIKHPENMMSFWGIQMPGCHKHILFIIFFGIIYNLTKYFPVIIIGFLFLLVLIIVSEIKPKRLVVKHKNIYTDPLMSHGIHAYTCGIFKPIIVLPELEHQKRNEYMNAAILHEEGHIKTKAALITILFYLCCHIVLSSITLLGNGIITVSLISAFIFFIDFIRHVFLEVVADKNCISNGYKFELTYLCVNIFKKTITNKIREALLLG
jgi:hypothetical protein